MPLIGLLVAACGIVASGCAAPAGRHPAPAGTLIVNAIVLDGSGGPGRRVSVRIRGDRIAEVGTLRPEPSDQVIDAAGLTLAPGFIDTHSHADEAIFRRPDALAVVSQGITTVVVGQDGGSQYPLSSFFAALERTPAAVNVASYVGHGTLRSEIMRDDHKRAARPEEVERMQELLRREMAAGALGLSSGLEYDPGFYSTPAELIELARVAGSLGGRYISHIRDEEREIWAAVDELIAIGRAARIPVQLSHVKLGMRRRWGESERLVRTLDAARASGVDVTADVYPYTYYQSSLTLLFPNRDFESRESAAFALREFVAPEGLLMAQFDPEPRYVSKTLAEIAELRGTDPVTTLIDLVREAEATRRSTGRRAESVIGTSMAEEDVARLIAWPFANICTDGELAGRHPRGFGAFPRVLARYVREHRVLRLEEAVRKMTSLAAANVGIVGRGAIKPGYYADLVLFDPRTVRDRATPTDPHAVSAGIRTVWVNGAVVFDGRATGRHPGRVVRRNRT